jgi:hypothetical protein
MTLPLSLKYYDRFPSIYESHYILFTNPYSHVIVLSVEGNSGPVTPLFLRH